MEMSLREILEEEIKDIYSGEMQITKALPKVISAVSAEELRDALSSHLKETQMHVQRLEEIGSILNLKLTGKKCKGMEGILEEGKEAMSLNASGAILDSAIVGSCQRVEHYEMASYGTAHAMAEHLELTEVAQLLQETLEEEKEADANLSKIAFEKLYPSVEIDDEEVDESDTPRERSARNI